jgi:hypothetical protein
VVQAPGGGVRQQEIVVDEGHGKDYCIRTVAVPD